MDHSTQRREKIIENTQKCFISWNSRGLKNKKEDLEILANNLTLFAFVFKKPKLLQNNPFH